MCKVKAVHVKVLLPKRFSLGHADVIVHMQKHIGDPLNSVLHLNGIYMGVQEDN